MYHVTPGYIYDTHIKTQGLKLRAKSAKSNYPPRIYLFDNEAIADDIAIGLFTELSEKEQNTIFYYYLLSINLTELKNRNVKFFIDEANKFDCNGCYIEEPISKNSITLVRKILVNTPKPTWRP